MNEEAPVIPASLAATAPSSPELVLLVDVDGTLSAVVDGKMSFNEELAKQLRSRQSSRPPSSVRVIIFTSYMLKFNLINCAKYRTARSEVIQRLQAAGIHVHAVIVTASPYAETMPGAVFGQYYEEVIKPLEIATLEKGADVDDIYQSCSECEEQWLAPEEAEHPHTHNHVTQMREKLRIFEDVNCQKSGKEEMFRHVISHFGTSCQYEIFDDKAEVLSTAANFKGEGLEIVQHLIQFPANPTTTATAGGGGAPSVKGKEARTASRKNKCVIS